MKLTADEEARVGAILGRVIEQRRKFIQSGGTPGAILLAGQDYDLVCRKYAYDHHLDVSRLYAMDVGRFAGWEAGRMVVTSSMSLSVTVTQIP